MTSNREITIHRGRRVRNFTVVNNHIIEARHLSVRARLALIYLLSKPDDWALRITDLRRVLGTGHQDLGRDTVYAVVAELVKAGYIEKRQVFDARSRFQGIRYTVWDEPVTSTGEPGAGGSQDGGEAGTLDPGSPGPFPEIQEPDATPLPDFPDAADQDLNKKGFKPRILPLPLPRRSPTDEPAEDDGFEGIWQCWPEHERPKFANAARKHFRSLSEEERVIARKFAQAYQLHRKRTGLPALMIPYLHERTFLELANGPPINGEGWFRVEPGRPEWAAWLAHHALKAGPKRVARIEALGFLLTPSRWPPDGHGSAQACAN